jgi:DNA-binding CsgD family transcriptional regulator
VAVPNFLGLTTFGVRNHVTAIHRIERVHSLKELAQKLGRPDPSKREQIRRALNTGLTYRQAAAQLGYTYDSVRKHGANLRREQREAAPAKAVIQPAKRADRVCKTDARR